MVTRSRFALGAAGLALCGGACSWTTFDDLQTEVWVDRVNNPDDSRQYGVALGAMPDTADTINGSGAGLVVLGRAKLMVSLVGYDGAGKRNQRSTGGTMLLPTFAFDDLPIRPAFAVDPADHRFAFASNTGNSGTGQAFVGVLDGDELGESLAPPRLFTAGEDRALIPATGLAFATLPDAGGFANDSTLGELVVARGAQLAVMYDYANNLVSTTNGFAECTQVTNAATATSFAAVVGNVEGADGAQEIVVGMGPRAGSDATTSEIRIYQLGEVVLSGSTVETPASCETPSTTLSVPAIDGGFAMLTERFDATAMDAALVYSAPSINTVFVLLPGATDPIQLFVPLTGSNFGYALATGDLDGDDVPELIIGAPRSDIGSTTDAGAVYIYRYAAGAFTPVSTEPLSVASPGSSEQFGTSLAVAPWGKSGQNVLVVGAEGKVFTYFRLAGLYDDVRTGR